MQPILFTDRLWCSSSVTVRSSGGAVSGAGSGSPHNLPEAHELKQPAIGLETPEKDVLRVASYNVENLFDNIDDPAKLDESTPPKSHEDMLKLANALRSANADVVSLQEVENIEILNEFLDKYLPDLYPYRVLVEGNDIRGIDVAVISKHPITGTVSHKDDRIPLENGGTTRFRRDFLRADIMVRGIPFSVYSTHFKAQSGGQRADDVRLAEAKEARRIIERDAAQFPHRRYVVTGDFNDVPHSNVGRVFLGGDEPFLNSALAGEADRITHPVTHRTIDYLLYPDHMKDSFTGGGIQRLPDEERGSDHYLIYGDFLLPRNGNAGEVFASGRCSGEVSSPDAGGAGVEPETASSPWKSNSVTSELSGDCLPCGGLFLDTGIAPEAANPSWVSSSVPPPEYTDGYASCGYLSSYA